MIILRHVISFLGEYLETRWKMHREKESERRKEEEEEGGAKSEKEEMWIRRDR